MKTSSNGIKLITSFEGCKLTAYKPISTEKYWTIGYGHYGADVKEGMKITKEQAELYLKADLEKFEKKVNYYMNVYNFNQNQFDALVSFAYNIGDIKGLTANGTRTIEEISAKFPAYNKANKRVLAGLTKRRAAEKELFDTQIISATKATSNAFTPYSVKINCKSALYVRSTPEIKDTNKVGKVLKDSIQLIDNEKNGWGHLANNAGWISLKYTVKV